MKRTLLFLAAVSAVLALPATAAAFRGVVVAKDPARHALVIASRGGVVRTVRAPARFGAIRAGQKLVFSARRLSDGTFRAGSLRASGYARRAVLRGVLVRYQRRLHRYLLSTGGSVLAVRSRSARRFSSSDGPRAGDRVKAGVTVTANGLSANSLEDLGHAGELELEGIYLGLTGDGMLRVAVVHRGEIDVTVAAGFQLPQLQPGDEIELLVTVDTAGAFTLVSVQTDDENDDDHEGIGGDDNGRVEVSGAITAISATEITVQAHDASPVTCAVPEGTDLSAFKVGDRVEMKCALVNGQLTLAKLKSEDDEDDDNGDEGDNGDDD